MEEWGNEAGMGCTRCHTRYAHMGPQAISAQAAHRRRAGRFWTQHQMYLN